MASVTEVLAQLEAVGTAQNRKVYRRHGAAEPMFGVSYKELGRIGKPLVGDNQLAEALWRSGNHDARALALRIADPSRLTAGLVHDWLSAVDNYVLAEELGRLVARSGLAREISDALRDLPAEWPASVGWFIVACTAEAADIWSVDDLRVLLRQIRVELADRPNRVRHEMNAALIAIGLRDGNLRRSVFAIDRALGPIIVDHGETGCKTPAITPYVERTLAHRSARSASGRKRKRLAS